MESSNVVLKEGLGSIEGASTGAFLETIAKLQTIGTKKKLVISSAEFRMRISDLLEQRFDGMK